MQSTEPVSISSAKKSHRCSWCDERIDTGTPYTRYRWFDGGDASTVKVHPECLGAMHEMSREYNDQIEFAPGDNPRGCWCGFDDGCQKCHP